MSIDIETVTYHPVPADPAWPDVPILQDGWWPSGGEVDLEAETGVLNWPSRELFERSEWLRRNMLAPTGDQSFAGRKTFTGRIDVAGGTGQNDVTVRFGHAGWGIYRAADELRFSIDNAFRLAITDTQIVASGGARFTGNGGGLTNLGDCAEFARSLTGSGYQRLPGGLILQWGATGPSDASGLCTGTLPIAFPTACLVAFATERTAGASDVTAMQMVSTLYDLHTTTTVAFRLKTDAGAAIAGDSAQYLAIGY